MTTPTQTLDLASIYPNAEPLIDLADVDATDDDTEATVVEPATPTPEAAPSPPTAADLAGRVVEMTYGLLDIVDRLPELNNRYADTLAGIQEAGRKWGAARKAADAEYDAAMTPLSATLATLEAEIAAAENAKKRLTELATTAPTAPTT